MTGLRNYIVTWEIDISAPSPTEAGLIAFKVMRTPDDFPDEDLTEFSVKEFGRKAVWVTIPES